jgi:hypothetical protein
MEEKSVNGIIQPHQFIAFPCQGILPIDLRAREGRERDVITQCGIRWTI